jgi:hypothetical protein
MITTAPAGARPAGRGRAPLPASGRRRVHAVTGCRPGTGLFGPAAPALTGTAATAATALAVTLPALVHRSSRTRRSR